MEVLGRHLIARFEHVQSFTQVGILTTGCSTFQSNNFVN